jgi:hypothetical protein
VTAADEYAGEAQGASKDSHHRKTAPQGATGISGGGVSEARVPVAAEFLKRATFGICAALPAFRAIRPKVSGRIGFYIGACLVAVVPVLTLLHARLVHANV